MSAPRRDGRAAARGRRAARASCQPARSADQRVAARQVERLAKQLSVVEDVSYTCETAAHFWLLHVLARWEKFVTEVERRRTAECVQVCCLCCTDRRCDTVSQCRACSGWPQPSSTCSEQTRGRPCRNTAGPCAAQFQSVLMLVALF